MIFVITTLYQAGNLVEDVPNPPKYTRDPNDDYLVALAISAEVDAIVSDNNHLLELKTLQANGREIQILTSSQFYAFLTRSGLIET